MALSDARSVFRNRMDTKQHKQITSEKIELYECGVDYITATATRSRREKVLYEIGQELVSSEAECGNAVHKWQGLGYHGQYSGSASYGIGPQGVLVRASSGCASENWRTLAQWSTNVTRLDVQATVKVDGGPSSFIAQRWEEARKHWLDHQHLKEPSLRSGVNGAETIELGSRQSERCGRIYDKCKESRLDHYRGCVRFEAEYKGSVSKAVTNSLLHQPLASAAVIPYVLAFFRKQRVALALETGSPTFIKGCAKNTDRVGKLIYLEKSVKPLILKLIQQGDAREVITALGLISWTTLEQEPAQPTGGPTTKG